MDKADRRRVRKTKAAIFYAFSDLMQEKRYANISVQNIIDRADIGRTTFYAHYSTKEELLDSYINHIFDLLIVENDVDETDMLDTYIPVQKIFEHILVHNRMLKSLLNSDSGELLFQRAQAYWEKKLEAYFKSFDYDGESPPDLVKNHLVTSAIGMIKWWSKNDMPYSPLEMSKYWKELVLQN